MSELNSRATKKQPRVFDHSRYARRSVALLVAYLGWDYDGLVLQADSENTIEEHLFRALEKIKLIPSREEAGLSKCGRTDKGVSALHQVFALKLRSNLRSGHGVFVPAGHCSEAGSSSESPSELEYASLLNRVLPAEIRVLAWASVDSDFSARHSCSRRVYKYLLPVGALDLAAMTTAGAFLVGAHDFRNFCKTERGDAAKGKTTERTIYKVELRRLWESSGGYDLAELTVVGSGFLWHMIRCIVAVLLSVGEGHERPEMVQQMLDLDLCPTKPQYALASDLPLCLFHAEYSGAEVSWHWDPDGTRRLVQNLQQQWAKAAIKAQMIRSMLQRLPALGAPEPFPQAQHTLLYPGPPPKLHKPFVATPQPESPSPKKAKTS